MSKRRRIAALTTAEQLGLLARICGMLLRHRRGSKAGGYYHDTIGSPNVLNSEELWWPTTCSSSENSSEAEVGGELARAAAARAAHGHCVGAIRQPICDN